MLPPKNGKAFKGEVCHHSEVGSWHQGESGSERDEVGRLNIQAGNGRLQAAHQPRAGTQNGCCSRILDLFVLRHWPASPGFPKFSGTWHWGQIQGGGDESKYVQRVVAAAHVLGWSRCRAEKALE